MAAESLIVVAKGDLLSFVARVSPGASRNEIKGVYGGTLKLLVSAPPEKGKANDAAIELISGALRVGKDKVEIAGGHASKNKRISVSGITIRELTEKLGVEAEISGQLGS